MQNTVEKCNFAQNNTMKKWPLFLMTFWLLGASCTKNMKEDEVYKAPQSVKVTASSLLLQPQRIKAFYEHNDFFTVWTNENNREELITTIQNVYQEALLPEKYGLKELIQLNLHYSTFSYEQKVKADLQYTQSFFKVIQHLAHGRINPKKFYGDWEPDLKTIDYNSLLIKAVADEKVSEEINSMVPKNEYYKGLREAFHSYSAMAKDTLIPLQANQTAKIKKRLYYLGDYSSNDFSDSWNEDAVEALKHFQKRHAITTSGKVSTETVTALNVSVAQRIKQIVANMERARWIPDSFGANYVMVNLPEFKLFVYEKNQLTETHQVIIGKEARKTPILSSSFSNLVINPTWTVPPTILKNDLVPRASADRGYFERNRMTIYNKSGQAVAPDQWDPANAKSYRYVQTTGGNNSLGLIKFDFPNDHMVYLHDTNNRSMFANKNRALSSGCVRVQNPFELATRILEMEGSAYNRNKLDILVARNKTQYIKLKKEVRVYQLYWTAWKNDQGVQFRDDVYHYDNGLYAKIMN